MTEKRGKPTLIDVANRAGVHFATASRALDPSKSHLVSSQTREKVVLAAKQLGYSANLAARGLRTGQSRIIGFVVADLSNPFLAPILRQAEAVLGAAGYWVVIAETQDDPKLFKTAINRLLARNVDGVVVSSARITDSAFVAQVASRVPTVLAVRDLGSDEFFSVTHDDKKGGVLAASHLADLGHVDLAQLRGPHDVSSFRGRSEGFKQVVRQRGLNDVSTPRFTSLPSIEGGYEAAKLLIKAGKIPTGIFAHNDMMAVGAIEAFAEQGLTAPGDFSIVGYNDAPLSAHLSPPLSTVRLSSEVVGELVAKHLLALFDNQSIEPVVDRLEPELVPRESTRPLHSR